MAEKDSTKTNPATSLKQISCRGLKGDEKKQCEKDRKAFAKKIAKELASSVTGGASKEALQEGMQGWNEYLFSKKDKKKK
jgi:hypothetical protein